MKCNGRANKACESVGYQVADKHEHICDFY
jgi:hypothetical protein